MGTLLLDGSPPCFTSMEWECWQYPSHQVYPTKQTRLVACLWRTMEWLYCLKIMHYYSDALGCLHACSCWYSFPPFWDKGLPSWTVKTLKKSQSNPQSPQDAMKVPFWNIHCRAGTPASEGVLRTLRSSGFIKPAPKEPWRREERVTVLGLEDRPTLAHTLPALFQLADLLNELCRSHNEWGFLMGRVLSTSF